MHGVGKINQPLGLQYQYCKENYDLFFFHRFAMLQEKKEEIESEKSSAQDFPRDRRQMLLLILGKFKRID